jgi:hypothetical protein
MPAIIDDPNFIRHALRTGTWERYEHPTKGSTLTLQIGRFPVISLHAILVDGPQRPVESFWTDLTDRDMVALLLAKVASMQRELQIAADVIARSGAVTPPDTPKTCETVLISMGDGSYSFVCTCGHRLDDMANPESARLAATQHENGEDLPPEVTE